jgi:hypothetical protein
MDCAFTQADAQTIKALRHLPERQSMLFQIQVIRDLNVKRLMVRSED